MEHDLELIIPRLEILEIEVCNILYNPGNIGKWKFSTFSYPGNIGKRIFSTSSYPGTSGSYDPYSVLSWKYWIVRSIITPNLEIFLCAKRLCRRPFLRSQPWDSSLPRPAKLIRFQAQGLGFQGEIFVGYEILVFKRRSLIRSSAKMS